MKDFLEIFNQYKWNEVYDLIISKTKSDIEIALAKNQPDLEDFAAMISPAAESYLEDMAEKSMALTQERWGRTISLYAPLYLSNECQNICTYCGFSFDNKIRRKTLSKDEIERECIALKELGFDRILLVTGEAFKTVGMSYFLSILKIIKTHFSSISMEVQPLEEEDYLLLKKNGVHGILVYQETYNKVCYKEHHTKGRKSNFEYRLNTPDRIGKTAMHHIGIGALLGLGDWRADSFFTALHLSYLERKYWQTKYSISFPRLRPYSGGNVQNECISDRQLTQLICAYRIFNQEVELSLSTRESEHFRNNILQLGINSMSAGSKTNPGGYSIEEKSLEQFEIDDNRSPELISNLIVELGMEPVWKDWDKVYS